MEPWRLALIVLFCCLSSCFFTVPRRPHSQLRRTDDNASSLTPRSTQNDSIHRILQQNGLGFGGTDESLFQGSQGGSLGDGQTDTPTAAPIDGWTDTPTIAVTDGTTDSPTVFDETSTTAAPTPAPITPPTPAPVTPPTPRPVQEQGQQASVALAFSTGGERGILASGWNSQAFASNDLHYVDDAGWLHVRYPAGSYGYPGRGGLQFDSRPMAGGYESMTVSYSLFVPADFSWVRGGKLPGLFGGNSKLLLRGIPDIYVVD
jgi:hypothetical protein